MSKEKRSIYHGMNDETSLTNEKIVIYPYIHFSLFVFFPSTYYYFLPFFIKYQRKVENKTKKHKKIKWI